MNTMNGSIELKYMQRDMHKHFFDRLALALENEFYFEAVALEYAAIEGRLEVVMGILGCPCNKELEDSKRKDIKISHRITCLKKLFKLHPLLNNSKLSVEFFADLNNWIKSRNVFIHGMYKNALKYNERNHDVKEVAKQGAGFVDTLYNETKKLRIKRNDYQYCGETCFHKKCQCNINREVK